MQRDQGDGFVTFANAPAPAMPLTVGLRATSKKFGRAVRPKTSCGTEERLRRVEPTTDHVAAHAVKHGVAVAVVLRFAIFAAYTQGILGPDKLCWESTSFIVGIIIPFSQADADRFPTGLLAEKSRLPGGPDRAARCFR